MAEQSKEPEAKTFTVRVQVGCRIQIPEPVVIVTGIKEGDIVSVTIKKEKETGKVQI